MWTSRTSESSRRASWIASHDEAPALGCHKGEIMTFDYGLPVELFMTKRKVALDNEPTIVASPPQRSPSVSPFPDIRTLGAFAQAKMLQEMSTEAYLDNALGLGNNLLRATFFKVDRTVFPWRD